MFASLARFAVLLGLIALLSSPVIAEDDAGWRISPEKINIQVGEDRRLQLLDDSAQEVRGAEWSIDQPELADLSEENGLAVIHAKAAGSLKVNAVVNFGKRSREITIWPADQPLPPGTTHWGAHSIGRDIRDLAAVPMQTESTCFR
jgi:hypothetical protein